MEPSFCGPVIAFSAVAPRSAAARASRWAWERRGRPHLFRETLPFVAVSLGVGAVLTEVSHFAYQAGQSMGLHGIEFGLFAQGLYIAANAVTFVIRFLIFNYLIFAGRATTPARG